MNLELLEKIYKLQKEVEIELIAEANKDRLIDAHDVDYVNEKFCLIVGIVKMINVT